MSLIIPANTLASGGYEVANSVRLNDGSSDYFNRSPSSATNQKTFTISMWVKRGELGSSNGLLLQGVNSGNNDFAIYFTSADKLQTFSWSGGSKQFQVDTQRVFRDVSAFYHILFVADTTQGTDSNRIKIYINGVQETALENVTYPSQNINLEYNDTSALWVGRSYGGHYFDGYMAEVVSVDGTALTPTDFGEFDEDSGIWKPIDVSGLTFGTNGFYLDFENSGALGADVSGNTNNFTVNNLTAIDQSTDTPTNNFATMNPLDNFYAASTFSEGNCKIITSSGNTSYNTATVAVSSGKWYVEAKVIDNADSNYHHLGIAEVPTISTTDWLGKSAPHYGLTGYDGKIWRNNSGTAYGVSTTTNDIVGMYIDLDNNKLYFAKNGTLMNSGTGHSITAAASTANGYYLIAYGDWENLSTATWEVNFGNPTYTGTDQTDANGYGSFEYNPSSGTFDGASKDFLAINTKNLAEYG